MTFKESFVTLLLQVSLMTHKILGIDPGSKVLGWAIVESRPLSYCASGVLKIPAVTFYERIAFICEQLDAIYTQYQPTSLVLEKAFVGVNKEVALKLGQIRGAVMAFGSRYQLEFAEYAPRQAKKTVTGFGAASKEQIFEVCKMTLKKMPTTIETFDESDAIALALCHHYSCATSHLSLVTKRM